MKTISLNRNVNVAFKQVQLLPVLTPEMSLGAGSLQAFCPTRARRPAASCAAACQLPRPLADPGARESALFAVLALSAVLTLGLALTPMLHWSATWPQFTAWVAQLLG